MFNEMFNDNFMMPRTVANTTPALNVIENKDSYVVELAAPGMNRDDIKLTLNEDKNLVVDIEKKVVEATDENKETGAPVRYLRHGFTHTKYHQTFVLPEDVKFDGISASALDGVLTITIPRVLPEEIKREVKEIAIN